MILSPNISSSPTLRNKSVHEQLCSLFSHPAMSSSELVIGPRWPKCGTFLTCVEARKGGLSTTTISDSGTTRCPCIMVISLPAMSVVIATPPFKLTVPRQILPRSWLKMPRLLRMVKLLDQLRWRHRSLKLLTLPKTLAPPLLSRQEILYCLSVGIVVGVAKETGRFSSICGPFNSLGWWLVPHVSELCPFSPKEPAASFHALAAFLCTDGLYDSCWLGANCTHWHTNWCSVTLMGVHCSVLAQAAVK